MLATLIEGARSLGVELSNADAVRMMRLLDELERWNRTYNLTSIRRRDEMVRRHLLDSLSVNSDLNGTTVADVGTGAGFPGLVLAIVNPRREFTLIDSNNKKIRFVSHVARMLGLTNVQTLHARVESMRPAKPYDTVVARAFAPLPELLEQVMPLCGPATRVLAMKGRRLEEEIRGVSSAWRILAVRPITVPGLDEARHVIIAALAASTAAQPSV